MTATKADLYRFVRRYVGDEAEAHDVLQEAYASGWLAMRRYDPARPFDVWLRSIALNKCRDWSRRRAVRRVVRGVMGLDAPEATAVGDDAPTPEARLDDLLKAEKLQRALSDLPDALKAPLLLAALDGRPHAEIASILRITPKAVETRIARARKKLSEVLAQVPRRGA
jgi:RNA polymerase sigma-70 factor (ECF subfamily)